MMIQIDFADVVYTVAINRIRHFYQRITPEIRQYLSFPGYDDERSIFRSRVIYTSFFWTVLSYPSGLILVINSLLSGAFAGLLIAAVFHAEMWIAVVLGIVVFLLVSFIQYRLGLTWYAEIRQDFQPRFPEPGR